MWKHHNLRVAYVAQHSFHHLEEHCDKSPVEYIQWRFAKGVDKEILEKVPHPLLHTSRGRYLCRASPQACEESSCLFLGLCCVL